MIRKRNLFTLLAGFMLFAIALSACQGLAVTPGSEDAIATSAAQTLTAIAETDQAAPTSTPNPTPTLTSTPEPTPTHNSSKMCLSVNAEDVTISDLTEFAPGETLQRPGGWKIPAAASGQWVTKWCSHLVMI